MLYSYKESMSPKRKWETWNVGNVGQTLWNNLLNNILKLNDTEDI